jgi:acetyl-CoA synthetase
MLMRYGEQHARGYDLSSLERVFCAGEVLNAPAWEWLQKAVFEDRIPVIDHMWQTETGGPIFGNPYGLGLLPSSPARQVSRCPASRPPSSRPTARPCRPARRALWRSGGRSPA